MALPPADLAYHYDDQQYGNGNAGIHNQLVLPPLDELTLHILNIVVVELLTDDVAGIGSILLVELPLPLDGVGCCVVVLVARELLGLQLGCHFLIIICHDELLLYI